MSLPNPHLEQHGIDFQNALQRKIESVSGNVVSDQEKLKQISEATRPKVKADVPVDEILASEKQMLQAYAEAKAQDLITPTAEEMHRRIRALEAMLQNLAITSGTADETESIVTAPTQKIFGGGWNTVDTFGDRTEITARYKGEFGGHLVPATTGAMSSLSTSIEIQGGKICGGRSTYDFATKTVTIENAPATSPNTPTTLWLYMEIPCAFDASNDQALWTSGTSYGDYLPQLRISSSYPNQDAKAYDGVSVDVGNNSPTRVAAFAADSIPVANVVIGKIYWLNDGSTTTIVSYEQVWTNGNILVPHWSWRHGRNNPQRYTDTFNNDIFGAGSPADQGVSVHGISLSCPVTIDPWNALDLHVHDFQITVTGDPETVNGTTATVNGSTGPF